MSASSHFQTAIWWSGVAPKALLGGGAHLASDPANQSSADDQNRLSCLPKKNSSWCVQSHDACVCLLQRRRGAQVPGEAVHQAAGQPHRHVVRGGGDARARRALVPRRHRGQRRRALQPPHRETHRRELVQTHLRNKREYINPVKKPKQTNKNKRR